MGEIDADATHNEIDTTTNVIWKIKKHCEKRGNDKEVSNIGKIDQHQVW